MLGLGLLEILAALFNIEIKNLRLHCIFFEDEFFKQMKVKGDGSYLYWAVARHFMSGYLNDVWTG